jgi:thiol-disulfide isomerase/thioredoxin
MNPRTSLAACVVLGLLVAAPASAGEGSLVGSPAPEIKTSEWFHGDGRTTLADFRGQVVLLEFWATSCEACHGDARHLQKLADDFGKKGLEVIALTSDDNRRTLRKYLVNAEQQPTYRFAIGTAGGYAITRLPCAVVVDPDGKVVLDGTGGRTFTDKDVESVLKTARAATPAETEARAARRLAFAETFAKDRLYARAEYELSQVVKLFSGTPSAQKAAARLKTFDEGDAAAERDAQWVVAKLVGLNPTFEHPLDRPRASEADALSKRLIKKADEIRPKAPRAAKLALEWSDFFDDVAAAK